MIYFERMFKEITNFQYIRSGSQAFGFYITYLFIGFIAGGIVGGLSTTFTHAQTFQEGFAVGAKVGPIFAVVYVTFICILLAKAKGFQKNMLYIILLLLSVAVSLFGGALLGLIIPAYLTTKQNI